MMSYRFLFSPALICIFLFLGLATTVQAQDGTIYEIRNVATGKCMDVIGASMSTRELVQVYGCHNGSNQRWKLENVFGDFYKIIALHSGQCLDVRGADTRNGRNIQQSTCHGGTNQQWEKIADGSVFNLRAAHSSKCIEPNDGDPFERKDLLSQWPCLSPPTNYQRWDFIVKAQCENGLCESAEGESCSTCPEDCGVCPVSMSASISGPTVLEPNLFGTFSVTVTHGTPPYSYSWLQATSSAVTSVGSSSSVTVSGTEPFNLICDVVDSTGAFTTSFSFVGINGGGGGGGPIIF